MTWSASISRLAAGLLAAMLCLGVSPARGQTAEQLYQQANDAYDKGNFEEACDLFGKVASLSPGYQESARLLNESCGTAKNQRQKEDEWFKQGVDLYNQGKLEDAKSKFEKAEGIPLKHPAHRGEISQYLKQIESQQSNEKAFQSGVNLFNRGQYEAARRQFMQVAQGNGPHAAQAQDYLRKISAALNKPPEVQPPKRQTTPVKPPQVSGTNPSADPAEPMLRYGLRAYFDGRFDEAVQIFSDYIQKKGSRQGLAFFFRGASYCSQYYLTGEKDDRQKINAVADFRSVKDHSPQFQPPGQYVSPKILALYSEAVGAGN
jgi:tetratricopeptide (TPR) repeat protein